MERKLTPRQREILLRIARGMSDEEIAEELSISGHTVRGYVRIICLALGAQNRQQAIYHACSRGLIPPEEQA